MVLNTMISWWFTGIQWEYHGAIDSVFDGNPIQIGMCKDTSKLSSGKTNIAIENGPFIVDLPIKDCDFSIVMLVLPEGMWFHVFFPMKLAMPVWSLVVPSGWPKGWVVLGHIIFNDYYAAAGARFMSWNMSV